MRFPCRRFALAAWLLAFGSGLLFSQTTGEIRGTVADANGVGLPGATVDASSPALQGTRSVVTGAGGGATDRIVLLEDFERKAKG